MSDNRWIWQCDHSIPSVPSAGRRVLNELLKQLRQQRWPRHDLFSIKLAVEEALINAIDHGNRRDPRKRVRIQCRIAPAKVRIEVADEGQGFNPAAVPDPTDPARLDSPGGRGVMLMRAYMSRVEYNRAGNLVALERTRTPLPGEKGNTPDGDPGA